MLTRHRPRFKLETAVLTRRMTLREMRYRKSTQSCGWRVSPAEAIQPHSRQAGLQPELIRADVGLQVERNTIRNLGEVAGPSAFP